jgi:hypothetical protein
MIAQITREDDTIVHIQDTPGLFWTTRNGRAIQRSWNELSATERRLQREAQERAEYNAYCAMYEH